MEGAGLEGLVHEPDLLLEGGDVVDELLHGLVPLVDVRRLQVVPVAVQNKLGEFPLDDSIHISNLNQYDILELFNFRAKQH